MFSNFLKLAWRNLYRHKGFTAINIIGLATGISFTLIIAAYAWSEYNVNRGLKNADRQYIVLSKWKDPQQGLEFTSLGPLAKELKEKYPTLVANYFRWDGITSNIVNGDKAFREGIELCDSTLFNMFGFQLIHGDPNTAFDGTYSVVITADKAKKFFGKTDVVGSTLSIENFSGSKKDFEVTGVMKNPPKNSITRINTNNDNQVFISEKNLGFFGRNMNWSSAYIPGYVVLQPGVRPEQLDGPLSELTKLNAPPFIAENMTPKLASMQTYYLNADNGLVKKMIYALSGVATFILLMAVINFINMSVSRASQRMREIGIRKVMGGLKQQLIFQFLTESILLVLLATITSLFIYAMAGSFFRTQLNMELPLLREFPVWFIGVLVSFILILGIIAGSYPAFVLSSLKSVESLKGKLTAVKENILLRRGLTAVQFGTATFVFAGAMIITQQVNYFFSRDLGYDKDYVVSAQVSRDWTPDGTRKIEAIRQQFLSLPAVKSATVSYETNDGNSSGGVALYKAGADSTSAINSTLLMSDEHFGNTFTIPMAAGEYFGKPGTVTDSSKIVINEAMAKAQGWTPAQAIGQRLSIPGSGGFVVTVSGVAKDFHFESMQKAIQPMTMMQINLTNTYRMMSFKLQPGNMGNNIAALQKKWNELMPGKPFEYKFMDESLRKMYQSELQLKQASSLATILSMIIVLLGVFGLITLSLHRRTKEIGIRKVLGSSVQGIISLFVKEFLFVILIAALIAVPLAWYFMRNWLNDYVYRINLTAMPFLASVVLIGLLTTALIVMQTVKKANASPVKSLRTE